MKRTVRDDRNAPFTLHDMTVISLEATDRELVMRTQSGMIETTPPFRQVDGYVEFHRVRWDCSHVYLLGATGKAGVFTGEKMDLKDFMARYKQYGFSVMEEAWGIHSTQYSGYLLASRQHCECLMELYHEGDVVFVTED